MKTSELRDWLEEHAFDFYENDETLTVLDMIRISKTSQNFEFLYELGYYDERIDLLEKVIEYSKTPIKERGLPEIKKYYVECNIKGSGKSTLRLLSTVQGYYLHEMTYTYFTKEGIEGLPTPIQRAIDCGFLTVMEVAI